MTYGYTLSDLFICCSYAHIPQHLTDIENTFCLLRITLKSTLVILDNFICIWNYHRCKTDNILYEVGSNDMPRQLLRVQSGLSPFFL
jgi:hypothetical protein